MFDALHGSDLGVWRRRGDAALSLVVHFASDEGELVWFGEEDVEGWFELEAGFEDGATAEDVEA
jgi:hypothetical protein